MIIHQDESSIVEFDETIPTMIWTPTQYMSGENFRAPFTKGIDFMEKKIKELPDLGWLNDARKLKTVKIDDLKWLNSNVNDRAYKFGAKKVAFVLPENLFGKMAVKFYVEFTTKRMDNKFQIKAFQTPEDAKAWLSAKVDEPVKEASFDEI